MANFLALVDPGAERRERFLREVAPLLPPVEGLVPGSLSAPPFAALWAADPHAPISATAGESAAIVIGTALRGEAGARVDAQRLLDLWRGDPPDVPEPFDGYHAALAYDPRAGLRVGTDALGGFPIYTFHSGDVLLVGSSPELFPRHPSFRAAFDPHGLVGILLTNGLVEGRTLWQGVKRLDPGSLLVARPGEPPREVRQYALPFSDRYFGQPFERHVEALEEALDGAVRRHVPPAPRPVLMLSGGLDSRTIAGFLARHGVSPLALTRGRPDDLEMRCAVRVARALGFEHRASENDPSRFLDDARTRVQWEHCANGLSGGGGWGARHFLRALGTVAVGGHSLDWIVGGYARASMDLSFEPFFAHHNRWGLAPETLERLLRRERFGDAVGEVMAALKRSFEGYSELDYRRAWCFALAHRQRFHIGSHSWAQSFGAWPLVPATDRQVLAVASGMPASSLAERRLQVALLCRRFPKLAALPLDRNSYDTDPLLPSFAYKLRRFVRRRWKRVSRGFAPGRAPRVERRRYYRQFDVNGPGWMSVREAAEPLRRLGHEYFHPEVLAELLPPPQARPEFQDGITGSAGMKSLLGFLLWAGRQAEGTTPAR